MNKTINLRQLTLFTLIFIFAIFLTTSASSIHNITSKTLTISDTPVANWTDSNSTNQYYFTINTNESINKTTILFDNSSFALDNTTLNSSGLNWTCLNSTNTITCTSPTENATDSINIWFNATSPTITEETTYSWNITTTDLNGSTNSTNITTGVDGRPPQINTENSSQNEQLNATATSYVFLTVNVSEQNIATVKINLSALGGSNETLMTKNTTNTIYYYNLSASASNISGLKQLDLNLTDAFGHYNDTEYINLTINDITKPSVTLTVDNSTVNADGTDQLIFTATVTDTELNNVTINLTELGGLGAQQMYNNGTHGDTNASDNIWTFNMTINNSFYNRTYEVRVNATDNSSNYNDSETLTITVVDVTPPNVTALIAIPSTVPANGTIFVLHANVSDLEEIIQESSNDIIHINISAIYPAEAEKNMFDSGSPAHNDLISGDGKFSSENITITDKMVSGNYKFYITATDINGNINSTEYIEINITDVTIPEAHSVNLTKIQVNATNSDSVTITANITDLEIDNVYANLSLVGGNATQIMNKSGDIYSYTFAVPNSIDQDIYNITINATDKSGNYNDTLIINITVIDTIAPTITLNSPVNGISYFNRTDLINISTDEDANVTYSIDGGAYLSLYNESKNGAENYPGSASWTEGTHNLTINATDAYGHNTSETTTFNLRPNLNITNVYLTKQSNLYTGDTTTINATIETYGFNVSNVTVTFTVGSYSQSQTYIDTFNTTTSPITIESNFTWNITTSKSHTFSVVAVANNETDETTSSDNTLTNTTFIQDFSTNATASTIDFGTLLIAGTSTKSLNLTNNANINQSALTETITLQKVYAFTNNFTRPEKKRFYFAVPNNTVAGDITITLDYNTSLGTITSTPSFAGAPSISNVEIDVIQMNSSSLPVNITVSIALDDTQWIGTTFNTSTAIENKSSEILTYNITIQDSIPAGNYTGTINHTNENNSIVTNITFYVNAPEMWITSNVNEEPVSTSSEIYTLYATANSGINNYSLIILNKNGVNLSDVFINFSSINFTKGNENITITLANGTDGVTTDTTNATFGTINANSSKSVILSFNVSNKTGTYTTKFNVTTSNGEPIENYSVTLNLVIDSRLDLSMSHSSVETLYPTNTTTFEVDVKYHNGNPVTGLNILNLTALTLKNGASQKSYPSALNNFTEISSGRYLLNLTLPTGMVGGDLQLGYTVTAGSTTGTYTEDIKVYAPYLYDITLTGAATIEIYNYGVGYETYTISIKNKGFESSGTLTATMATCGSAYLAFPDADSQKSINPIAPGATSTTSWSLDPKANLSSCPINVTITGGKFWFTSTNTIISTIVTMTDTTPVVVPVAEEETTAEAATTAAATCDVTACDSDEACVNGVCAEIPCNDGYFSDHSCVNYIYTIDYTELPTDLSILQGNHSTIKIKYKNTGTKMIEDFNFTITGLNDESSYELLTSLPDEILDSESLEISIVLNISNEAPVGRRNLTINFISDKVTSSENFILAILPDEESINEVDDWMPKLEKNITQFKNKFENIKDKINGTNLTFLNDTVNKIEILYDELKNATIAGDYLTVYERKAEIEKLIAEANKAMAENLKQGSTLKYLLWIIILVIISGGAYLFYDQSRPNGYHILKGFKLSNIKQLRLILFNSSEKKNKVQRVSDIHSFHHKPTFEIKILRIIHIVKQKINRKLQNRHTHQTKLSSDRFMSRPEPKPHTHKQTSLHTYHPTHKTTQKHTKPVKNVSHMMKTFEISKTRCGVCGKDFKTKHELELHRKYSHKTRR